MRKKVSPSFTVDMKQNENELLEIVGEQFTLNLDWPLEKFEHIQRLVENQLHYLIAIQGEYGWCIPRCDKKKEIAQIIYDDFRNREYDIVSVEEKISSIIDDDIILQIIGELSWFTLIEQDKIDVIKRVFDEQLYFVGSIYLTSIIDALSIEILLRDIDDDSKAMQSQGWNAYKRVINKHFHDIFGQDFIDQKGISRIKRFVDFVKVHQVNVCDDSDRNNLLLETTYALIVLFDTSDWTERKKGYIPASVNRHWLMHGMYETHEITRCDFIKLLFLLRNIVELYSCF